MVLGDVLWTADGSERFLDIGKETRFYQVRVPDLRQIHLLRKHLLLSTTNHHLPIPFASSEEDSSHNVSR